MINDEKLKKLLNRTIENIQWWQGRCNESFVKEEMIRTIDNLRYFMKESYEHEEQKTTGQ